MNRPKRLLVLCAVPLLLLLGLEESRACDGSRRPACGRSAWVAKWVREVVVHPGDDLAVEIKIGLLPYVTWNQHPNCGQPVAATLALTLTCEPDDGGAAVEIGPVAVPVAVPSEPGSQAVLTGPGMTPELGGEFCFEVPAGLLPAGKNYVCDIVGEYTVTFLGGLAGNGGISGFGDTQVCIVEPSPLDASVARLHMERMNPAGDDGFQACRRGDQAINYYLIANNDDTESVVLELETWTNQVARKPKGGTAEDTFAISSPKKNTDNFPQRFIDDLPLGGLVSTATIMDKDDQRITRALVLGPNEIEIIAVGVRSHGMCADGSCSEVIAKVSGEFTDGTPALACAGTALVVADVPAKSALCEYEVTLAVAPGTDGRWTRPEFDKDHMLRTHYDNIEPFKGTTIATSGASLNSPWPDHITDILRVEHSANSLRYTLDGYRAATNFQRDRNKVTLVNLPPDDFDVVVPHVFSGAKGSTLKIAYDAAVDALTVKNPKGKKLFQGGLVDLIASPPSGLGVDAQTFLRVQRFGPGTAGVTSTLIGSIAELHDPAFDPDDEEIAVLDARTLNGLPWTVASRSPAVNPLAASGAAGDPIVIDYDLTTVPTAPDVLTGALTIGSSAAVNDPLFLPFALRAEITPAEAIAMAVAQWSAALRFTDGGKKDVIKLSGALPVEQGMELKGEQVAVVIGPLVRVFELTGSGKSKGGKKNGSFELTAAKQDGVVQAGDAAFEVAIKKGTFGNLFKCYGLLPQELPPEGAEIEFPVQLRFLGAGLTYEDQIQPNFVGDEDKVKATYTDDG